MVARISMVFFLLGTSLLAADAVAQSATMVKVQGEVWVIPPEGEKIAGAEGMALPGGTLLKTGVDGKASLEFEDGTTMRLRKSSSIRLSGSERKAGKKESVVLFFGQVWNKVTPDNERRYEVRTPNAVCGVRGTVFEAAVADDGSVRVIVAEGEVGVGETEASAGVTAGQQIEANEGGVGAAGEAPKEAGWEAWEEQKRQRFIGNSRQIADAVKDKIMVSKANLEALRKEQEAILQQRKRVEGQAKRGVPGAVVKLKGLNQRLAELADAIADAGDQADSRFGLVDHFADLADDPRFAGVDREHLKSQAKSLRAVKASLDRMVKEGTDMSMESMNKMMDDMKKGPTLFDGEGSAADELFR